MLHHLLTMWNDAWFVCQAILQPPAETNRSVCLFTDFTKFLFLHQIKKDDNKKRNDSVLGNFEVSSQKIPGSVCVTSGRREYFSAMHSPRGQYLDEKKKCNLTKNYKFITGLFVTCFRRYIIIFSQDSIHLRWQRVIWASLKWLCFFLPGLGSVL